MRFKTFLLVAIIAAWGILNTGLYVYLTNVRGINPTIVSFALALLSIIVGSVLIIMAGAPHGFNRDSWRPNAYPFAIVAFGIAILPGLYLVVSIGLVVCASCMTIRLIEEDNMPPELVRIGAVCTALLGALLPVFSWRHMDVTDDVISFALPIVLMFFAYATAVVLAIRPSSFLFEEAFRLGLENPGAP